MDYNRYIETECSQEEIMHYITFLKRIQQIGDKHSVYENDTISILGLKIEILNAWSDTTNEHNKNLCDYAAMCILITGNEEKFLFCSDIPKGERESIFETYKCEMDNIDYMQSSDCFSYQELLEINRLIKPKIFFYDEMADYKDKLLKCDMVLYDYGNDYNSIVLK